ncbi:hypothetical protein PILCRDRAFT_10351 [Piloderma croceum F 1598]|uniref:Uncharacterized protein n=1 Tax=Piloderma croceum (strain F 1598) TaxID=765440 RepID=A0A0C3FIF0_PILCF|nr:hypothetical protein PILCRDRAFT_10351 [Piloderma croceum F 1598]
MSGSTEKASSIAYVETSVGVTYNFAAHSDSNTTSYIIPTPSELATTTSARWLSDVITINPSCSFAKSNVTKPFSFNSTNDTALSFSLPDTGIELIISSNDVSPTSYYSFIEYITPTTGLNSAFALTGFQNKTTQAIPSDGSSVWLLAQCIGIACENTSGEQSIYLDLSGLPVAQGNIPNGKIQFVFLHCLPHPTIATHEIRSDGKGTLTVQPDGGRSFRRQGNLDPLQVGMLLSAALTDFQENAGPQYPISGLGTQAQMEFIFGKNQMALVSGQTTDTNGPAPVTTLAPQSLSDITAVYTTMLQAAAKVYMTGTLGTAYVPGRISTSEVVFDSSLPHVMVSTFLFIVLSLLVVVAHFRSGKERKFTLFGVAAALHRSGIPAQFAQMKAVQGLSEEKLVRSLGGRVVSMNKNGDDPHSLHLS